jgi:hypothetical protein
MHPEEGMKPDGVRVRAFDPAARHNDPDFDRGHGIRGWIDLRQEIVAADGGQSSRWLGRRPLIDGRPATVNR